ncbi:MAG: cysteine desulfurase [Bryobacterales bacterium]|nr:cysteine desulfurase [Bryobacterales bacterium]
MRADFPALGQLVRGRPLVYLDNAATTQKPRAVVEALVGFYTRDCANVHRGVHELSQRATEAYESARRTVARFLNATPDEIVFTRGTTEAINLVAQSFGRSILAEKDEILVTELEHHSNIVPWQMLAEQTGARLVVAPINDRGEIVLEELERRLNERTRLIALAHVSNALGTVNPVEEICRMARQRGIAVLVDGAQAVPHLRVDVRALGCDFYAFSGHKIYGPTGIGVLYGKAELLERMPPYQGGGDMIRSVSFAGTLYNDPPFRFEAGTPHIAGAIGLAAAIEYLDRLGLGEIGRHEQELLEAATIALAEIPGVRLVGTARHKAAVVSFVLDGVHPHDVATVLDHEGVAVRAGHHCAQPLMERLGLPATTRASFALYNTLEEVEVLARAVRRAREIFG